jgi:multiple sugar transport system substrate-binding protein
MRLKKICTVLATLVIAGVAQADMTVLGWPGGPEEKALNKLVEQYNTTQGITDKNKVKTIYFSRGDFFDKLMNDLAAGSKEFDVNLLATYNVGRYAPFMDELPASVISNAKKSFPASVLSTQQYKGKQYGIPTDLSLHFLYFRQDLINKLMTDKAWQAKYQAISKKHLGTTMSPKNPQDWTWEDFKATALFFTKSINPDSPIRYGTALQLKNLLFNIMIWQSAAYSEGGNWMQDDSLTLQSDAYQKGLETFKCANKAGRTSKASRCM